MCFSIDLQDHLRIFPLRSCCGGYVPLLLVRIASAPLCWFLRPLSNRFGLEVSRLQLVAFLLYTLTGPCSFGTAIISRFFLGFSEAVYFPGALLLLSRW